MWVDGWVTCVGWWVLLGRWMGGVGVWVVWVCMWMVEVWVGGRVGVGRWVTREWFCVGVDGWLTCV